MSGTAPQTHMSLADLRTRIWEVHGVTVGEDDPVMVLHTIHAAFLDDYQAMLDRHHEAMRASVGEIVGELSATLSETVETFQSETLTESLRDKIAQISEQARIADQAKAGMRRIAWAVGALSLVACGAAALSLFFFLQMVK